MKALKYACPKCSNKQYEVGQFRAAGGLWSKIFDIQSRKFTTVTCDRCKYTEIYKANSKMLGNIFDFFRQLSQLLSRGSYSGPSLNARNRRIQYSIIQPELISQNTLVCIQWIRNRQEERPY